MKAKIVVIALFVGLFLAGCATAEKFNQLHIGMSQPEVVGVLGQPDSKSAQGEIEYYTYYLMADNGGRDQPYCVRFVKGRVESFGRFAQLFDIYNRPVNGGAPAPGYGMPGIPQVSINATPAAQPAHVDLADQIQKLKTLKDQGAITDEEFQRGKALLLQGQK
jgi:hypothetical protein